MQTIEEHDCEEEKLRRNVNGAVNRLILETVQLEDDVRRAVRETLERSLAVGWLDHHSAAEVERTYAIRVSEKGAEGLSEVEGRRIAAVRVSELLMDSLREAAGALAHVDGYELPDSLVLTLLVRHLLAVRRLEVELER